jgi:hypothetical protein
MSHSTPQIKRLVLLAAALAPIALLTGCANMVATAPSTNSFSPAATLSGQLHGGNQPITGAIVTLYGAGTGGYGSPATQYASTTSASDAFGSFQFSQVALPTGNTTGIIDPNANTYACPASNPQMYIFSKGGATQGPGSTSNQAAAFIIAIGPCSTAASSLVNLNEVTTVATLAALQQYFNPNTEGFGYNTTAQSATGFANGVATISNLADVIGGSAVTSKTLTGTNSTVAGTTVTLTPETAKINTIADILASCVNSNNTILAQSDSCKTLFTNAVAPAPAQTSQPDLTFSGASDTLQAAYYMLTNPTESLDNGTTSGKMFNLYGLVGGTGAPFQPTLAAQPTDWTIGVLYNASTSACTGTASGKFIFYAYQVRSDANGNIWIGSNGAAPENISEVGPTGVPMACVTPSATAGLYTGLTIDTKGNIWAAAHSGSLFEINPTSLAVTPWTESSIVPWAIEADGEGNVFYTSASKPVHEFPGAATASTATASTAIGTSNSATPNFMTIDKAGNVWTAETSGNGDLFQNYPDTSGAAVGGYSTFTAATNAGNVQAQIAVDASSKVWTTQTTPANMVTVYTAGANGTAATGVATTTGLGGLSTPRGVAFDGAGNAWIPDGVANKVVELDKNAAALSPSTGFTKSLFTATMRSVTVDPTGNVWIGTNATTVDLIEEIVGAGVPVVTPLAAQLAAGKVAKP